MCRDPTCLICYANRRGRSNYKGHWGHQKSKKKGMTDMGEFIRRRTPTGETVRPLPDQTGSLFASEYMALLDWLTTTQWPDGTPRVTSSVTLFIHDGAWKACFSDREAQRIAFVTGPTLEGLLEALDRGLQEDSLEWKVSTPPSKSGSKKA